MNPDKQQSFTLFPGLPFELRHDIWQHALHDDLPARLLNINHSRSSCNLPTLLQTNRESRRIALSVYVPWPLRGHLLPVWELKDPSYQIPYVYVSPSTDTFIVRSLRNFEPPLKFDVIKSPSPHAITLRNRIRHIAIPCSAWWQILSDLHEEKKQRAARDENERQTADISLLGVFQQLESINVLVTEVNRRHFRDMVGDKPGDSEKIVDLIAIRWSLGDMTTCLITAEEALRMVRDRVVGWKMPLARTMDSEEPDIRLLFPWG